MVRIRCLLLYPLVHLISNVSCISILINLGNRSINMLEISMSTTWCMTSSNRGLSIIKTFECNVAFLFRTVRVLSTILETFVKCELKSLMPDIADLCIGGTHGSGLAINRFIGIGRNNFTHMCPLLSIYVHVTTIDITTTVENDAWTFLHGGDTLHP